MAMAANASPLAMAVLLSAMAALAALIALSSQASSPTSLAQQQYTMYPSQGQPYRAARFQMLPQFNVGGALEVPDHPPGMPYIKTDPIGEFPITSPDGDALGNVNVRAMPPPSPPPPTIIRFGDVGVSQAGCPMCPVLDKEAAELQRKRVKDNQKRITTLEKMVEKNAEQLDVSVDRMKKLKELLGTELFNMKEAVKDEDATIDAKMKEKEASVGPQGPKGPAGYDGLDGINGEPGKNGMVGPRGQEGPPGPIGSTGARGARGATGAMGPQGPPGTRGKTGREGPRGPLGPRGGSSNRLRCARIGGEVFKGVCFKSAVLTRNKDNVPKSCRAWVPHKKWNEKDWWALAQMFRTNPKMTSNIDREVDGGWCDNFGAVTSFSQNTNKAKVWVNKGTFSFNPTAAGSTCNIMNEDDTVAIYACAV